MASDIVSSDNSSSDETVSELPTDSALKIIKISGGQNWMLAASSFGGRGRGG